jgi:hypothetical protein
MTLMIFLALGWSRPLGFGFSLGAAVMAKVERVSVLLRKGLRGMPPWGEPSDILWSE